MYILLAVSNVFFQCLLIKVTNFASDENAVLWPETTCLDGWEYIFSENIAISASTKVTLGFNYFLVSTYQIKQPCF